MIIEMRNVFYFFCMDLRNFFLKCTDCSDFCVRILRILFLKCMGFCTDFSRSFGYPESFI